jgi:C4-dicarboxylate-specific signal transduction histidine kinase
MKLRIILIVLSLLAFLSASAGGYLYYSSLKKSALKEAERQADLRLRTIKKNLTTFLSENVKPVKTLAGMQALRLALTRPDAQNLAEANATLDHFKKTLAANVCYLMDPDGKTIASTNRYAPDSFVGQNFAFRPYRIIFYSDSRRKLSSRNDKAISYKIKIVTGGNIENHKIEITKNRLLGI